MQTLRAVSGRIDKKLAVFVEDAFAKHWVDAILREGLGTDYDQVEVHVVHGDGNAIGTHRSHKSNPAIATRSLCVLDGDSQQLDNELDGVMRLPGAQPELEVFQYSANRLEQDLAILTVSCQRAPESQEHVREVIAEVHKTNRDPHLLFNQVGLKIGFVPEAIVRGAFLSLWVRGNVDFCERLTDAARQLIRH